MAAIFEAPATHEAVHEAAQEWEWEHHEGAHQPESHEWEAGMESHEWEGSHEWESPSGEWESHEWESQEWEGNPEWEGSHELESPSGEWESHEWESHEWEVSPEWEADPFIGKAFKAIGRGIGKLAKRLAPFAVRALGGMIPGVGAIAGPVLGQIAQRALR